MSACCSGGLRHRSGLPRGVLAPDGRCCSCARREDGSRCGAPIWMGGPAGCSGLVPHPGPRRRWVLGPRPDHAGSRHPSSVRQTRTAPLARCRSGVAEDGGFEPPRVLSQHDFQSCALGHYANPPRVRLLEGEPPPEIVALRGAPLP